MIRSPASGVTAGDVVEIECSDLIAKTGQAVGRADGMVVYADVSKFFPVRARAGEQQPELMVALEDTFQTRIDEGAFAGAQDVLKIYAQQISDSIQKDGFYIRVPSGKQFYLYVLQTLDRADASVGGAAIPVAQEIDEPTKTISRP